MTARRVLVTGRGVVSPLGVGVDAHFAGLVDGACAIAPLPRLGALGLAASRGAEVDPDVLRPNLSRLPRKQQKLYNRATLLAMLAAALAMEDAGLGRGAGDPARFGVVLGVGPLGWDLEAMTAYLVAAESPSAAGELDMAAANAFCMRNINPLDFSLKTLPNLTAGHLAIAHDAQAFCRVMIEGPVGGAHAVGDGYRLVAEGDLDAVLCGGADAQLEELLFATCWGAGVLGSDDGARPGYVAGEGSGLLVLEAAERAGARGARAHGEILAFASAAGDGRPAPEDDADRRAAALARVLALALDEAGAYPDVVCLHGDGVPVHDRAEALALHRVLGARGARVPRLRMKSQHGDLGAAATPVELLACTRALGPGRLGLVVSLGIFGECAALVVRGGDAD